MTTDAAADPAAGRRARLLRLADERGIVAGLALDHRDSFRSWLRNSGISVGTDDQIREIKLRLARVLAPAATVIMLDAELGRRAFEGGAVPTTTGLIMPLEAQGYDARGDERLTTLMTEFTATDAARLGADACKLLVPYRPDVSAIADHQDAVIGEALQDAHAVGLPLVVEPVIYRRSDDDEAGFATSYPVLVCEAVRRIRALGPDLLKLPFPVASGSAAGVTDPEGGTAACQDVDRAADGVPWVLLGAGVDAATFAEQVRVAGAAGASGFLAGRGIWGPALDADGEVVEERALATSRPAFDRCRRVAEVVARPLPGAA